jgi:Icc protein
MRILQISDLHIGKENEKPSGIDVKKHFLQIVKALPDYLPDMIILSGDLTYKNGDIQTYKWIRSQLLGSDLPFFVIPGNHDDPAMIRNVFHPEIRLTQNKLFYSRSIEGELFLFLDSSNGELEEIQLQWIKKALKLSASDRVFVFMHHPPLLAGVAHMDNNHALRNREKIKAIFIEYGKPSFIYCGHYHVEKNISCKNLLIQICPAGFYQMDGNSEAFKIEHATPGFRVIDIGGETVQSHSHYLMG